MLLLLSPADDFAPNLVFYGPSELLPSGTPGDPAREYNRRAARACGALTSGEHCSLRGVCRVQHLSALVITPECIGWWLFPIVPCKPYCVLVYISSCVQATVC
jgi:hypothetical protein